MYAVCKRGGRRNLNESGGDPQPQCQVRVLAVDAILDKPTHTNEHLSIDDE
jgi:hypothetical protein